MKALFLSTLLLLIFSPSSVRAEQGEVSAVRSTATTSINLVIPVRFDSSLLVDEWKKTGVTYDCPVTGREEFRCYNVTESGEFLEYTSASAKSDGNRLILAEPVS